MSTERPWKVCYPERVRRQVVTLSARAAAVGLKKELTRAFKRIDEILHSCPHTFGEEMYRLPALKLQARAGTEAPLWVRYTVHETEPLVFVIAIGPLARSGLE
jgi:hypothetical protein